MTAYGRRHPESFGEVRLDGDRVVATFVGDLAAHAAALSTLVDRPAAVIVCPATLSAVEGQTVANEILAESNSAMLSIGIGADGRVDVQVRADHRDTADSLLRRHGPKVRVTLGQLPYPDINSAPQQRCPDLPTAAAVNDALHWTVEPDVLRVNSGGDLTIRVSWTNTGSKPVTYESGDPITGLVTRVGSTHVVAVYAGAIAGVGHGGTLEPGATDAVSAFVSTGSCDPTIGWALPAGTYDVYFPFGGFDFTATGGMRADQFVSTPFILTITDEPAPPLATRPPGPPLTFPAPRNTFG